MGSEHLRHIDQSNMFDPIIRHIASMHIPFLCLNYAFLKILIFKFLNVVEYICILRFFTTLKEYPMAIPTWVN